MNRRLGSVAVLLLSTMVLGCRDLAKPRNLSSVSITLERTLCEGTCPSYVVTLHGNGAVEYLGKSRVDIPGLQTSTVEPRRILDLLQTLKEIHFFELQDHYFEDCTDLPTAIVTLHEDGRSKEVSNYYGGCERKTYGPQVQLAKLSEQIDSIAQTRRWVRCNSECVGELVRSGLNVNASGPDGETALLVTIREGDLAKMRALLDAGADLNVANSQGTTPLMQAVIWNQPDMVRELLARGADVNAKDSKGFKALAMTGDERIRQLLFSSSRHSARE